MEGDGADPRLRARRASSRAKIRSASFAEPYTRSEENRRRAKFKSANEIRPNRCPMLLVTITWAREALSRSCSNACSRNGAR